MHIEYDVATELSGNVAGRVIEVDDLVLTGHALAPVVPMDVGIGNPLIKHLQREGIAVDMEGVIVEARPCALTVSPVFVGMTRRRESIRARSMPTSSEAVAVSTPTNSRQRVRYRDEALGRIIFQIHEWINYGDKDTKNS